jgi:hypothetical protein
MSKCFCACAILSMALALVPLSASADSGQGQSVTTSATAVKGSSADRKQSTTAPESIRSNVSAQADAQLKVPTHVWAILGGISHHFVPASSRDALNQHQGTVGIEIVRGPWALQLSHMNDSYGCSSNELAAVRRWHEFGDQVLDGGFMLGTAVVHRCTRMAVDGVRRTHWAFGVIPGVYVDVGRDARAEFAVIRSPWTGQFVAYVQLLFRLK